jgi:hypothetical protein
MSNRRKISLTRLAKVIRRHEGLESPAVIPPARQVADYGPPRITVDQVGKFLHTKSGSNCEEDPDFA